MCGAQVSRQQVTGGSGQGDNSDVGVARTSAFRNPIVQLDVETILGRQRVDEEGCGKANYTQSSTDIAGIVFAVQELNKTSFCNLGKSFRERS